ncbi:Uncharacterised protein [Mycobacteroides abscessus subsp. abscessus]|nr:Uncharacterised protein [Mycobacteroides abscessus subsp. abscessus]
MSTSDQTKAHLAKVLKVQMQHKPLDRITIAELSAAAHVNRNTFVSAVLERTGTQSDQAG